MVSHVYAQETAAPVAAAGQSPGAGLGATLFPMAVVMLIFYFLLIRPQRRRDQQMKTFLEGLKRGDEVVTQAGLMGRIAGIEGNVILLEIAQNVKVRLSKSAIIGLQAEAVQAASK